MGKRWHYTYRVKFPSQRWFYFGMHSTDDLDDGYCGSPDTHRDKWRWFKWDIEILEFHESRKRASEVENRLIKPFLNDPQCLNDNVGGVFSEEAQRRGRANALLNPRPVEFYRRIGALQDPRVRDEAILKGQKKSVLVRRTPIILTHPDGTEEQFDSQIDAVTKYSLNKGHLNQVLKGHRTRHKGFTARYL